MARDEFPRGPNLFHPEKPSAVGSRNSLIQEGRDKHTEAKLIINEEIDKILNHVHDKLPPEVLVKMDVMGTIKDKLYNYVNQSYTNMFNRYMVTMEDEMQKKTRDFIDKEEYRSLARYTPREIAELLDKIGGMDKFNSGETDKSIINMYGHLQGHIQRGINDLENETNSLLRQKTDVGAFVRGENAYSIVKCSFKDNKFKPKTVTDVKLSINILDSELISPIFHYQVTIDFLIRDLISKHILDLIDREIEKLKDELVDEGKPELTDTEVIFEKINRVENYTDDDAESEDSKRYTYMAKRLMDRVSGLRAEIAFNEFDALNIRENIKKIIDNENIRNRGFNTAINSITSILDTSKMGYQYIENLKNARKVVIKEYEDVIEDNLPDERYQIAMSFFDQEQLIVERDAFDLQMSELLKELDKVWDVLMTIYQEQKPRERGIGDFEDLYNKYYSKIVKNKKREFTDWEEEEVDKVWDEITFIRPELSEVEKLNKTFLHEKIYGKNKIIIMKKRLQKIWGHENPITRVVMEERINFLEEKFDEFSHKINPYHLQPGLLLDIDITSVKKKKSTLYGMANVLNEFLHGISKGFQDAAFASFARRRSTVRADLEMHFESAGMKEHVEAPNYDLSGSMEITQSATDTKTTMSDSGNKNTSSGGGIDLQEL